MSEMQDPFGWVGATIDAKYRVDAVVGEGGFGVVYRAHHLGFDQTVAIKCLRMPKTLAGPERERFRETFLVEGRILHRLSRATAGIVQALDLGAAVSPSKAWTPYIVLEWLEGVPLDRDFAERRQRGLPGRSVSEAVALLGQAARALAFAHEEGVAHRDIKPANLFLAQVSGRQVMKVLDFGIAKVMSETESVTRAFEETGASTQAFTAKYGAPEQFSRRYGATGPWTDVFALTLVLVEAVIGRAALEGGDATQLFVSAADPERRPTLRHHGVTTSDELDAVLRKALAIDPRERFATAAAFWDALEAATARDNVAAGLPSSVRGSLPSLASGTAPTASDAMSPPTDMNAFRALPSSRSPRTSSSGRALIIAGGLSLVVGIATAVAGKMLSKGAEEHAPPAPSVRAEAPAASVGTSSAVAAAASLPTSVPEAPQPNEPAAAAAPPPIQPSPIRAAPIVPSPSPPPPHKLPEQPFSGVPTRDISAGPIGAGYVGGYKLLARQASVGLDFVGAANECSSIGLSLCSSEQWAHACSQFPELAPTQTWTSSMQEERVVVRGGETCGSTSMAAPIERSLTRFGFCCERAIAMTTDNLQKNYLVTTADRILALEHALNQHNTKSLLELTEATILIDGETKTQDELKRLIEEAFKAEPNAFVLNDHCHVSVQAKRVTQAPTKRSRKKKVVYHTQGWTAECRQTAITPAGATQREVSYNFSATSKLREIETKREQ